MNEYVTAKCKCTYNFLRDYLLRLYFGMESGFLQNSNGIVTSLLLFNASENWLNMNIDIEY